MTSNILGDIAGRSAYALSSDAGCFSPDSLESAGAQFLTSVRDGLLERVRWELDNGAGNMAEAVTILRDGSGAHEVADGAPSVYTAAMWAEFVDLGAYREDATEYGDGDAADMDRLAGVCLYIIASRLVDALLSELETADEDDDEDEARAELEQLEAEFEAAGGRGVELAERIDALRARLA